MKIKNILLIFLIAFLNNSCNDSLPVEIIQDNKTKIEFNNLERFDVTIYLDPNRQTVLAEVPALSSIIVPATPAQLGVAFYPTFHFELFEISDVSIPYNGTEIIASIEPNITTRVPIPKLDQITINNSYIKIINESSFSLSLRQSSLEKSFIGSRSTIISPNESAAYDLLPGLASDYTIMRNVINPVPYPIDFKEFEKGIVYVFTYNGSTLSLTKLISLIQSIPPAIPENVILSIEPDTLVNISWNTVYGASSYNIYRATDSPNSTYTQIAVTSKPLFTVTDFSPGHIYFYKISSSSGIFSESGLSSEVFIITSPKNFGVTENTTVSITLKWDNYVNANSFNIYRFNNNTSLYSIINSDIITSTTYVDNNVILETGYSYRISANFNNIEGLLSDSIITETISTIPKNISVIKNTTINNTITWDMINGSSGFNVYRSTTLHGIYSIVNPSLLTSNLFSDHNVSPDTTYYYKVTSINNNVESLQSNALEISTLSAIPINVRSTINNLDVINITWESVSEASGYNIYRANAENGTYTKINTSLLLTFNYNDTLVSSYTTYFYKVSAIISGIEREQSLFTLGNTGIIVPGYSLNDKLSWLQENAVSNSYYKINVINDEYISSKTLSYTGKSGISIVLVGIDTMRKIYLSSQGSIFTINTGVTFILENNITLIGRMSNTSSLITIKDNGLFIMNDNTFIIDNSSSSEISGGGVTVDYGSNFIMNGGKISGNSNTSNYGGGGGVCIIGGSFTMNDGEISYNNSTLGGGIYISSYTFGSVSINGGIITNNSANNGGGIYILNYPVSNSQPVPVSMNGGEISCNVSIGTGAFSGGGGVYIFYGNFTLNNGKISGNVSNSVGFYGGGAGVYIAYGSFIMKNGEISGNTHLGSNTLNGGGGIHMTNGDSSSRTSFRMSGGVIYGNSAASGLSNTGSGAATLYYYDGADNRGAAQYGTFNGNSFTRRGNLTTTNATIRVVNGVLLSN